MPKRSELSVEQIEWLTENFEVVSYAEAARRLSCDVVTLKRHLVRLGLREFDDPKYAVAIREELPKWRRPCISCGSTEERDKFQYRCNACTDRLMRNSEDDSDCDYTLVIPDLGELL